MRGTMKLIMGNMFAGKTTELITRIDIMRKHGRKKVLILKPSIDTRSGAGKIKNFHGRAMDAIEIPINHAKSVLQAVHEEELRVGNKFDVIAIDEVQFFTFRSGIYRIINELLENEYDVIAAGLRLDFRGEPFGSTLDLVGLCEGMHNVTLLSSFCTMCGKPAHLPQRLIDGDPAPYESTQIQVGGKESYEARCYECHKLPGRPSVQ
ncbi:MAG: thymidine kinase [Candidatus Jorgensenbacteria bacterium]|nr:thymidine kinase [Candidatus Jorgensenbacteria bacterium]